VNCKDFSLPYIIQTEPIGEIGGCHVDRYRILKSDSQTFESQLSLRNIPDQQRHDFHKWFRFYLDFCNKYTLDPKLTASFAGFDEKLKIKEQSVSQRMAARRSIAIYYRMIGTLQSPPARSGNLTAKNANNPLPLTSSGTPNPDSSSQVGLPATKREMPLSEVTDQPMKLTGANWGAIYEQLKNAIKVRHYSNKTWQAYRYWLQQFQTFTKSKDTGLLGMDDVKGFLSNLAVNKQVAASSQNQAFNALLFFFKNVLQKELGKVEYVVRAKWRPYIPVV